MKRLLILVLLVPILALTMISCDADMRSNIAGFMGDFGGNVYADAGLIVANTAQAEAAAATIAAIGTGDGAKTVPATGKTEDMGVEVSVPAGTTLLAPQTPAKQQELKDNLGDAFNSETQKKKLLEDLKKPVLAGSDEQKAAQGTVEVFNKTLDKIKADLDNGSADSSELGKTLEKLKLPVIANTDDLTQGDMLALQLMTDLIKNTVTTLTDIGGTLAGATNTELEKPANRDKILSIVDDALFAADMAEQLSGAASIDFTGQIDLGALLEGLDDNKGTRSRGDDIALTDAEDFIGTINDLGPSIVELMGITYDGTSFVYSPAKYKSFLLNQQIYRSSMEQALKMMSLGKLKGTDIVSLNFDTSTLVKYALSVFITEHDAFWKAKSTSGAPTPGSIIALYLNDSAGNKKLGLGTLTKDDVLTQPTGITGFDYADWPAYLKLNAKAYYQAIVGNILKINDFGGIAQLSTEIKKEFYDPDNPSATDGLSEWYDEL